MDFSQNHQVCCLRHMLHTHLGVHELLLLLLLLQGQLLLEATGELGAHRGAVLVALDLGPFLQARVEHLADII